MSLFMAMIAFISITTSCEQDLQSDTTVNAKSGFNAEATYHSILDNTESGMQQFDVLTNSQKVAVWEFKYERFKDNNTLSIDQIAAIDVAINLIKNISFSEGNETAEQATDDEIRNVFDSETADFLLLTLENNGSDVGTEGCFWCLDPVAASTTCCAYRDPTDNHIIDFRRPTTYRVRRFWIGWTNRPGFSLCSMNAWQADGGSTCQ
jgi:hypothetical protein